MQADPLDVEIRLLQVECLRCGHRRSVLADAERSAVDECPSCGYVGWASSAELSEQTRRRLRERPVERRHLRLV